MVDTFSWERGSYAGHRSRCAQKTACITYKKIKFAPLSHKYMYRATWTWQDVLLSYDLENSRGRQCNPMISDKSSDMRRQGQWYSYSYRTCMCVHVRSTNVYRWALGNLFLFTGENVPIATIIKWWKHSLWFENQSGLTVWRQFGSHTNMYNIKW